ncbi:hypothetical protein ACPA9J_03950 [Pseudomonas aeruginosa]
MARIAQVETTITANKTEALLLEQTLIREWRPPYNIPAAGTTSPIPSCSSPARTSIRGCPCTVARRSARGVTSVPIRARERSAKPQPATEGVSRPPVRGQLFPQPYAALPAIPDQALQGPCVGLVVLRVRAEDVRHSVMFLEGRSNCAGRRAERRHGAGGDAPVTSREGGGVARPGGDPAAGPGTSRAWKVATATSTSSPPSSPLAALAYT